MAEENDESYPRPDFVHPKLNWTSLNGPWDFLFDDEDTGHLSKWHVNGLPNEVVVERSNPSEATENESESIVAKIAGGTSAFIPGNLSQRDRNATTHRKRKIEVPYVFQSPASGINERGVHEVLWYERSFADLRSNDEKSKGHRLVIRFGAVDYEAKVWVNGQFVGGHRGGHVPFDLDLSDAVEANAGIEHRLTLRVYDSAYNLTQPRGKQYWGAKPESIFYTPSSGIWQNVWLESLPPARIADSSHGTIIRGNDIASGDLQATVAVLGRRAGQTYSIEIESSLSGITISKSDRKQLPKETNSVSTSLNLRLTDDQFFDLASRSGRMVGFANNVALWSPTHPHLYDLTIRLFDSSNTLIDTVHTYTGVRSLNYNAGDGTFHLNNKPIFQALCLDQGYWPSTFMTPPHPFSASLKRDIELSKALGFNGCRKHQKVEDPVFLYWADKLGYLVWGEMANGYQFSDQYVERFDQEWMEAVRRDINHPSVIAWTPVNESWGYSDLDKNVEQRRHIRSLYYLTKTLDPTRPINDNCGWQHVTTDLTTFHDYSDSPQLTDTCSSLSSILSAKANRPMFLPPIPDHDPGSQHKNGAPVLCTEFGGVNIAPAASTKNKRNGDGEGREESEQWGYTTAANADDLLDRVKKLVDAIVDGGHCCGFVWTQLADIEQETNGLYTLDRVPKLDVGNVKKVMEGAVERYYKRLEKEGRM
ncbi:glycoside hydrolase family 2 protein [Lophiostoma macrostomum CBS 122681]|uniref:Glycoside hydrolase family 2 protein n=1 Tax=Lophiostoma macrostomum CBS 122681 TaxID=1314788 RepID=A0A6A6SN68_9PLEO|nr:glycoside hydrolase family 2 protein [Lophiostoma macrostomum CBS 122681]